MPPSPPYPGYLQRLADQVARERAAAPPPPPSPFAGAGGSLAQAVTQAVERAADALVALSHDLHANPELGYEEHGSVRRVARVLADRGQDSEIGAFGLDTALRAEAGSGDGPRVAVLAEYDALPGIGHACGHNVIAATATGAFLGLAALADDLGGTVRLYGCPAEEGGGGKELMARQGAFDDLDAVLMLHPAGFEVAEHPWLGVRTVDVTYRGLAAHAAAFPFLGRNALDAVVQAYSGLALLRQHMLPSDRVHGIITDGGQKPNIVPDHAAASFYLRSAEPETLRELSGRAREILEAAALSTATAADISWDPTPTYLPVRNNGPLAARYAQHMGARGRTILPAGVVPESFTGSTDLGNVSVRVPAIHPTMAIAPIGVSIHNPEFTRYAAGPEADRGCVDGALGLALTAADLLADEELRAATRKAFEDAGGVLDIDELLS
jgi:amidohydrolase